MTHIDASELESSSKTQDFYDALGGFFTEAALHYQPIEHVTIRRFYLLTRVTETDINIQAQLIAIIYTSSFIITTDVIMKKGKFPSNFVLLGGATSSKEAKSNDNGE